MKNLLLFIALCSLTTAHAQTELSGEINVYTALTAQDGCTNTVTVADASAFSPGMGVILLQTRGANIDLSNTSDYGNVTDFNGVGRYEYNRIADVNGNELTLDATLLHEYDASATQVVGFQIYAAATVTAPVRPAPWNGITGGVLALEVNGTLVLEADVDADGRGFRGGAPVVITDNNCNFLTNADDYAYAADNWRGAPKGEGIGAGAPGAPYGRGAQANGGGGGNDHNSGGGGGSLLTPGGQGGENNEPSTFGCDGEYPGRGGKLLPVDNQLAFLGGGGGSGHANNVSPSGGGNGGGIVFLIADTIIFAGGTVRASGEDAVTSIGDGGGGGGAGGSVFLLADHLMGTAAVIATGGKGGDTDNGNNERCFGPGGGGSGGALWSNVTPDAQLIGGEAGRSINSPVCTNTTNGALAGAAGWSGTLDILPQGAPFTGGGFSLTLPTTDTSGCAGTPLVLTADVTGSGYELQWQTLDGGAWTDLIDIPGQITGTQTLTLTFVTVAAGTYRLTLLPDNDCFDALVSTPVTVTVTPLPNAAPTYTAMGNTVTFLANTVAGDAWAWMFLPGQSSNEENPVYTFPGPGTYEVLLSVSNACGTTTYPLSVVLNEPLVAQIDANAAAGCAPLTVLFNDASAGPVTTRAWSFPGGDPATSTEAAPVVTFAAAGTYSVTLTVSGGGAEATATQIIEVVPPPLPDFTVFTDELTISLQNNSQNATDYVWNFGDGNTSMLENPVHVYATPGTYEVSLNATNAYCASAVSQTVGVDISATDGPAGRPLSVSPNPTTGKLDIQHWTEGELVLYTLNGQPLRRWSRARPYIDLGALPDGVYLLRYHADGRVRWWRIVKT